MKELGGKYSSMLGIDLSKEKEEEIFKWFLAAKLYAARISEQIATSTYHEFKKSNLLSPDNILKAGWDKLVGVLDRGGYARYDFSTATKLLEIMKDLNSKYNGSLITLYKESKNENDLEERLKDLGKGIGNVTVNIFLRELRNIWRKADPQLSDFTILGARRLKILTKSQSEEKSLSKLKKYWKIHKIKGFDFVDFEAALLKLGKNYIRKKKHGGDTLQYKKDR